MAQSGLAVTQGQTATLEGTSTSYRIGLHARIDSIEPHFGRAGVYTLHRKVNYCQACASPCRELKAGHRQFGRLFDAR